MRLWFRFQFQEHRGEISMHGGAFALVRASICMSDLGENFRQSNEPEQIARTAKSDDLYSRHKAMR